MERELSTNLQIRLTEEQLRVLSRRAAIHSLPTSTWARMILLREAKDDQEKR